MCGYCQGQSVGILVDGCLKTSHGHMVQPTQHMFLSPSPLRPFAPSPHLFLMRGEGVTMRKAARGATAEVLGRKWRKTCWRMTNNIGI